MSRSKILPLFLLALAAASCGDGAVDDLLQPGEETAFLISDAAHLPGRAGFYFLPPMVAAPSFSGTFDPDLSPEVRVCPFSQPACATPIKTFNSSSAAAERLTVDLSGESYNALWNTKNNPNNLSTGKDRYRLEVWVGTVLLGYADLWFVTNAKGLKDVTDQYVGVVRGSTLTIKFRIETGTVGTVAVTPPTAEIFGAGSQLFTATVTDLHGDPLSGLTVNWSSSDTDVATVSPTSGTTDGSGQTSTTASTATESGTTTITAEVQGVTGTATLDVTLNRPPVAVDDGYTTPEDAPLTVLAPGVLGNDTDPDGDALTTVLVTDVTYGTLALFPDGSFMYTPFENFNGTDSFTYNAHDGTTISNAPATVTITVTPVNDAPVAVNDTYSTDEDVQLIVSAPGVLANDTDVDGDALSAILVGGPANGTLTLNANGSLTYAPNAGFNGSDSFTYKANDGGADSNVATVTITVNSVNDPPTAVDDGYSVDEDNTLIVSAPGVLANDTDLDGDPLTAVLVSGPSDGTLTLNADGSFSYTPAANFNGADDFTYKAHDGSDDSNVATVTITVNAVNDAPVAVDDSYSTDEDVPLIVSAPGMLGNDTDVENNGLTAILVSGPANGTLTLNADGSFTYAPNTNFNGADSFTYKANDGSVDSNVATVTITVDAVEDAATAVDDAATVDEDATATIIDVLANDTDPDNAGKSVAAVSQPANGTVVITNAGANLTYAPNPDYCNAPPGTTPDDFTYTLSPGGSTATVSVTVTCVDDPPVAVADAATVDEDAGATAIDVLVNDTDVDGGAKSITSVTQPANGAVVITGGGTGLTYQPNANYCNTPPGTALETFTYTLVPGGSSTTVTVTVTCINDPPVAGADLFDFIGNTELRVDLSAVGTPHALETTGSGNGVLGNDADPVEGDPISITGIVGCADNSAPFVCPLPGVGTVTLEGDGRFSFLPEPGDAGATESFQYVLTDGTDNANGTVTLTRFERVWYVADNAAGGGTGTSVAPLNSFASLNGAGGAGDADVAGDHIFVYFGGGSAPGLSGLVLEGGQHLIGHHAGLSLNVNLNGNGAPTALVAAVAGNRPFVTGDVTATDVIPAEIVGMNLAGSTANAIDWTTTAAFAGTGTFSIRENVIRDAPAEGVDINLAGTGATNLAFHQNTVTSTGTGMDLQETGTGAVTITQFHDNAVNGNTGGSGMIVSNAIFDATPGGGLNTVSGGTTAIGASGNGVGAAGLALGNVQGDLHFTNLSIFADAGAGLTTSGTGAGMQVRVNTGGGPTGVIEATGGPAVDVSNASLDVRLASLRSTNSAGPGVSLTNVPGTFSAATGSTITNATGTDFAISGGTADVTYDGTITDDVGQLVSISGATAGTKAFTGAISDGDDGDGSGISLSGNTGATIRFSGGVVLSTGANPALAATGGGTLEVCDENPCNAGATGALINKLTTTTGTALNVANTTIGSNNLEFRSISAGTAASGPTNGIVVNTTGSAGGLKVKGTGSAGTGGTIQRTTGPGILLTTTSNVQLSYLNVQNGGDDGIRGSGVNNLALQTVSVSGNGNSVGEAGIELTQLTGTGSMANSTVTGSAENNVVIVNTSGTLTAFNVTNSSFTNTSAVTGDDGIRVENNGSGVMNVSITGSTFTDNKGDHFQFSTTAAATGTSGVTYSNNTLTTTPANDPNVVGGGITLSPSGSADLTFTISNNNVQQAFDEAINLNLGTASTASASMIGTISGNIIGTAGDVDSGSESGTGISVISNGAGLTTVAVTNNQVRQYANPYGILINSKEGSSNLNATVTGNTVENPGSFAINGIRVDAGATTGDSGTLCAAVTGNNVANGGLNTEDIRLRQRFNTTIRLPGYAGANNDLTAVNTFVAGNNAGSDVSSAENTGGGGGGFVGGAACAVPN